MFDESDDYERILELVSEEEIEYMVNRYMEVTGKEYGEEELTKIISWLSMVRFEALISDLILTDGLVVVEWNDELDEPLIRSTKESRDIIKSMNRDQVNSLLDDVFGDDNL